MSVKHGKRYTPRFKFQVVMETLRSAWFDSDKPLRSGWAWGQDQLYGRVTIAEAKVGKGQLFLFGPEVLFRAQPHGTFNFVFNGIFLGCAKPVTLK